MSASSSVLNPSALAFTEQLQPGEPGYIEFFFISPVGREDTYYRRLMKALGPSWPATLIRPSYNLYARDLYASERVSESVVDAIRGMNPSGPFLVVGFCFAGAFAFDVAGRLAAAGCAGAIIVDSPMPGHPQFLPTRQGFPAYKRLAHVAIRAEGRPSRGYVTRWLAQKLLWYAVLFSRPILQPLQKFRLFRAPVKLARLNQVGLFRLRRLPLPVLCFVATSPVVPYFLRHACDSWTYLAGPGSRTHIVDCPHDEMFFRSNLPEMAGHLSAWLATLPPVQNDLRSS